VSGDGPRAEMEQSWPENRMSRSGAGLEIIHWRERSRERSVTRGHGSSCK